MTISETASVSLFYLLEKLRLLISRSQFHVVRQVFSAFHPKHNDKNKKQVKVKILPDAP